MATWGKKVPKPDYIPAGYVWWSGVFRKKPKRSCEVYRVAHVKLSRKEITEWEKYLGYDQLTKEAFFTQAVKDYINKYKEHIKGFL